MNDLQPLPERHPRLNDIYNSLKKQRTVPSEHIVTISGERSTGTSAHAKDLEKEFGIEHVDNGTILRETAKEHGYVKANGTADAKRFRKEDPEWDLKADGNKLQRAYSGEPLIAEGRLDAASLSAPRSEEDKRPIAALRAKIVADDETRGARYAEREELVADGEDAPGKTVEYALRELKSEDASIYGAFADLYDGIEPRDDGFYDVTIDNSDDYTEAHRKLVYEMVEAGFPYPQKLSGDELEDLGV